MFVIGLFHVIQMISLKIWEVSFEISKHSTREFQFIDSNKWIFKEIHVSFKFYYNINWISFGLQVFIHILHAYYMHV